MTSTSGRLLQPLADQLEQLRDRLQVPVGAGRVDVPEEGGQQRHPPVDVLAGAIPVEQRAHGKGMAEVMRARAWPRAPRPSRPTSPISLVKVRLSSSRRHPPAAGGDEERRRCRARGSARRAGGRSRAAR